MMMPGRQFTAGNGYRYGFNGKENDREIKGDGNQYDYGFRIYDPRIGRFKSVDPLHKEYPMFSSYQYAGNRPIVAIDLEGLEPQEHPYLLKPIGKPYLSVTNEGRTYEAYQVNSPSNGKTWVAKIIQKVQPQNGFEMKPIEHFMYHDPEGGWQPWQRGDEPSIRLRQINQVVDGIGVGFYGIVAAGAATPAAAKLSGTYLGSKLLSTGIDFTAQMITSGGKLNDINVTSLSTSFVFNKTNSLSGLFLKNTIANGLQYNTGGGYQGLFGEGVNNTNVLYNIGVGTLFDKGSSIFQNLNSSVTPATLGRWKNLSYKPKYSLMLQQYQRNQNINNFFNSVLGQIGVGTLNNAASKSTDENNP